MLTDKKFFAGSLEDLKLMGKLAKLPVLRKDFIIDEYQIYESRLYNADAVLLIASVLSKQKLNRFIKIAEGLGMGCLVEVHTEKELQKVLATNAGMIGINNRNLKTLKIDIGTTLRLMGKIPKNKIIVSESGISSRGYIKKIEKKVNAVLIGTLFMNSDNLEKEIKSLLK